MKILKHGRLPEEDIFRGTCSYCKTEFECKRHEGKMHYARDQRDENYLTVDCPVCTKSTTAYKYDGGQLIPEHKRRDYTWNADSFRQEGETQAERFGYR